ncbi:MAG: hypothetical protein Tsb0016_10220 [Sphingomonadales bacterium]
MAKQAPPRLAAKAGFTVLEVLVALAISALAITMLVQAIGGAGARLTGRAQDAQAADLAARIMEAALVAPTPAKRHGQENGMDWQLQITPLRRADGLTLQRIDVVVSESGATMARLTSARLFNEGETP